jgi:hypothetical protein
MRGGHARARAAWACAVRAAAAAGCGGDERPARVASAVVDPHAAAPAPAPPSRARRLSDEWRLTRYAHAVVRRAPVRSAPRASARRVGRLRYRTEDGPLETYLALELRSDPGGREWVRVRLPGRPNGRVGWVPRSDLGPLVSVHTHLRIERSALRATLYERGRRVWSSRIAVGRPSTPTPAGRYWIRSRLQGIGGAGMYGPWAFGTSAYAALSDWPGGGVVGIHGTDRPELVPGRVSHGCIRVPNGAIRRLAPLLPIGTPVRIV